MNFELGIEFDMNHGLVNMGAHSLHNWTQTVTYFINPWVSSSNTGCPRADSVYNIITVKHGTRSSLSVYRIWMEA